jgi:hypothetical protein
MLQSRWNESDLRCFLVASETASARAAASERSVIEMLPDASYNSLHCVFRVPAHEAPSLRDIYQNDIDRAAIMTLVRWATWQRGDREQQPLPLLASHSWLQLIEREERRSFDEVK